MHEEIKRKTTFITGAFSHITGAALPVCGGIQM